METERTLEHINALDVKTIEVFLQAESEYGPSYINKLKEKIDEYNMSVTSVHGFCATYEPFLFAGYKRRRKDAFKSFEKVLKAGKLLGAKYFSFHGNRADYIGDNFNMNEFAKIMNMLSTLAGDYGIKLAWENVSWCQSNNPGFIKEAIGAMDMKNICFTLDIKQAVRAGYLPLDYIDAMKGHIGNVHINDWDESGCRLPGDGTVDLKQVFLKLDELSYSGDFIIEVYSDNFKNLSDFRDSINFLKNLTKNCSTIKL